MQERVLISYAYCQVLQSVFELANLIKAKRLYLVTDQAAYFTLIKQSGRSDLLALTDALKSNPGIAITDRYYRDSACKDLPKNSSLVYIGVPLYCSRSKIYEICVPKGGLSSRIIKLMKFMKIPKVFIEIEN